MNLQPFNIQVNQDISRIAKGLQTLSNNITKTANSPKIVNKTYKNSISSIEGSAETTQTFKFTIDKNFFYVISYKFQIEYITGTESGAGLTSCKINGEEIADSMKKECLEYQPDGSSWFNGIGNYPNYKETKQLPQEPIIEVMNDYYPLATYFDMIRHGTVLNYKAGKKGADPTNPCDNILYPRSIITKDSSGVERITKTTNVNTLTIKSNKNIKAVLHLDIEYAIKQ